MTKRLLILVAAACALLSCVKEEQQVATLSKEDKEVREPRSVFVPGQVIVQFDEATTEALEGKLTKGALDNTGNESLDRVLRLLGATSVKRLYPDAGEWEERHREAGLHTWYIVNYDEEKAVETKAGASLLSTVDGIVYTEPMRVKKSMAAPFNDPYFSRQWHYYNDGSKSTWVSGADINVVPVWTKYTAGSSEVIVSVVDGGIDLTHEDLAPVTLPGGANGSRNFFKNTYEITAHSHGTHVAGTIGAINNNGKGVCGIAGGSDGNGGVKLISCQVFDNSAQYGSGFYEAMVWGADHGAVISQNSWGDDYETLSQAQAGSVGAIKGAIDYFIKYAGTDKKGNQTGPMKGGVVIFAAGNDGWPIGWPAAYDEPRCVAVGSFSSMNTRAYYSNYGDWVDIAAPGGDAKIGPQVVSTVPGGYGEMQGTSMACPHVSGVAALIVSYFGGPGFTNDMLVERLLGGANADAIPSSYQIGPRVDAYGSFRYGSSEPPVKVTSYTAEGTGGNINFEWTVGSDPDDEKAFGYILFVSPNLSDFTSLKPGTPPSTMKRVAVEVGDLNVGDVIKGNVGGLEFNTQYYCAIAAYDYGKAYSEVSQVKSVKTTENQAPKIETSYTGNWKIRANQIAEIPIDIYDPDHHQFSVTFNSDCENATMVKNPKGTYTLKIDGTATDEGKYKATFVAKDSYGKVGSKTFNFEVLPNHAPVVKKNLEDLLLEQIGKTVVIDINDYLYDEDGDDITFVVEHTNSKILHVNPVGNILNMTSLSYGLDEIIIHAYDIKKAEGVFSFKVSVRNPDSEADIYPTQVTDVLKVAGGSEAETIIRIYSSTGQLVYEATTTSSAFNPAVVDMSGLAPGIYRVVVIIGGKQTERTIVKL